jgi:LysR family transcriptional regulator for bpeEF and oprC
MLFGADAGPIAMGADVACADAAATTANDGSAKDPTTSPTTADTDTNVDSDLDADLDADLDVDVDVDRIVDSISAFSSGR